MRKNKLNRVVTERPNSINIFGSFVFILKGNAVVQTFVKLSTDKMYVISNLVLPQFVKVKTLELVYCSQVSKKLRRIRLENYGFSALSHSDCGFS